MSEDFKIYTYKGRKGIDDLEGYLGDGATDWWTLEERAKWNAEQPNRDRGNKEYIKRLKETGEYGKEYTGQIHYKPNSLFNDNSKSDIKESYRYVILDLNEKQENN